MPERYSEIDDTSFDAEELLNPRAVSPAPVQRQEPADIPLRDAAVAAPVEPRQEPPSSPEPFNTPLPRQPQMPVSPQPEPSSAPSANYVHEADVRANDEGRAPEELIGKSTLRKLRMFSGIVLFFLAAYSLIVTISYFANLSHDQSALLGEDYDPYLYGNAGGMVGAWMSHFLLYEWLGVGGFIFIYYVGALSLKLLNVINFRFWSFTFKCLLSAIAVSIIGGFFVEAFHTHSRFYWGGLHGYMINHQLTILAGVWGALGVSAIMAGLLIVMFIDSISKTGRWIGRRVEALRERRRREQAEFNARREEAERIRQQEEEEFRREEARKIAEEEAQERAEQEAARAAAAAVAPAPSPAQNVEQDSNVDAKEDEEPRPESAPAHEEQRDDLFVAAAATVAGVEEIPSVVDDEPLFDPDSFTGTHSDYDDNDDLFVRPTPHDNPQHAPQEEEPYEDETETPEPDMTEYEEDETDDEPVENDHAEMVVEKPVIEKCTEVVVPATTYYDPTAELSHFTFPSLDLLRDVAYSTDSVDATEMEENKVRITKTLGDYGIPISHIHATVGPTVTLYEIIPAEGVRIAKIKRLEDDIAMSLAALGIRIIAPIPGKGTIGIEVPNKDPQVVSIRSILSSRKFQESNMELPMALGCTISNDVFMADLAKMPHLLVAGATGMGKSVGLNTIIASLLYKKHPAELKFVLIDPKMVEFSLYASLENHYLAKLPDEEDAIITDPSKVVATLNSLCIEMDNRYALLKMASCRNIKEYNERIQRGNLMAKHEQGHRFLPYIVVIVDEFADLIMTAGKEVETPIARIAQKARAVGIHMILATQRPSTNVITGVIKANFPGRVAFRVFQMVDSRTILDRPGANQLIGRGDMLFSNNGKIERVQCAFIDTPEVEAICEAISRQVGMGTYPLPEYVPETDAAGGISGNPSDRDPLFGDAARYVVQTDTASTSSLQRRYSIGYNRAGKIMDQLEAAGIVGPSQGGKPRQVLMDTTQVARMLGDE